MNTLKKLASLLFHRTALVALLLVAQVAVLIVMTVGFSNYFLYFYWFFVLLSILAVLWIVSNRSDPGYKIAWIIPILIFPVFGGLLYLLLGGNRLPPRIRSRLSVMGRRMWTTLSPDFKATALAPIGEDAVNQARYLERYANCPLYQNTITEYFPLGDDTFPRMLEELRKAQRYIFLEYFIIDEGEMWSEILGILEEKAAQGLDVRVLYDDVGCLYTLPAKYHQELERRGIRCCAFNRFVPVMSIHLNNRDHRKLCIIDGSAAFTGGINLADEYINRAQRYGHWKDSAILVRGEAAWSMVIMFLTMWEYVRGESEGFDSFRPRSLPEEVYGAQGWVLPYTDSPLDGEPVGETVYINLISKARRYVYITTPYLIISHTVNVALCSAAKSGVEVCIITPHVPDKRIIFEVTRAHYEPLLEAGVRIFEYTPGFMHAKNFAVDDLFATVGTVNMDYRSMFLHFENGVWLCGQDTVIDVRNDFQETREKSVEISLEDCRRQPLLRRLLRSILRLFAPMM